MITQFTRLLAGLIAVSIGAGSALATTTITVTNEPYNADATGINNSSTGFANALTDLVAAGGGTLIVPPGNYHFTSRATVNLSNTTVTIQGRGRGVSQIFCNNSQGIFYFNNTGKENELNIYDITLLPDQPGSGTAIINNSPGISTDANKHTLSMRRVDLVRPRGRSHDLDYFTMGINMKYLQQPVLIDVYFIATQNMVNKDGSPKTVDDDDGYVAGYPNAPLSTHAYRLISCNSPYLESCYGKYVDCGFMLGDVSGTVICKRLKSVSVNTGYSITCNAAATATVQMIACHNGSNQTGVEVYDADTVNLIGHLPYPTMCIPTNHTSIILRRCANATIEGCAFHYLTRGTAEEVAAYKAIDLQDCAGPVMIKNNLLYSNQGTIYQPGNGVTFTNNMIIAGNPGPF